MEYTMSRPNALLSFQLLPVGFAGNSATKTLPFAMVGGLSLANHSTASFGLSSLFQSSLSCPFRPGEASKACKYPRTILLMALHGASFGVRSLIDDISMQGVFCNCCRRHLSPLHCGQ